jgi:hypothetical protein
MQLGQLYQSLGEPAAAQQYFARAAELAPRKSDEAAQAKQALARLKTSQRSSGPGSGELVRQTIGPLLISAMAALANARLSPLYISLLSWIALMASGIGAYVWASANVQAEQIEATRAAAENAAQPARATGGVAGVLIWAAALIVLVIKV